MHECGVAGPFRSMRPEAADQIFEARVRADPRACLTLQLRNRSFQLWEVEGLWAVDSSTGTFTLHAFTTLYRIRQQFQSPLVARKRPGDSGLTQGRLVGTIARSLNAAYSESLGVLGDAPIRDLRILEGAATRIAESESCHLVAAPRLLSERDLRFIVDSVNAEQQITRPRKIRAGQRRHGNDTRLVRITSPVCAEAHRATARPGWLQMPPIAVIDLAAIEERTYISFRPALLFAGDRSLSECNTPISP